jgi:ACR3 family arsenite efflux pump ArsB
MSEDVVLTKLEKSQPFILIAAMFVGLLMGVILPSISQISNPVVYYTLIGLMVGIALGTPFQKVADSFKNIRFFALAWGMNFIVIPFIGFVLALIFLNSTPLIFVGFILYVVNPCTDWFLVFTAMAKGDVPLGLALLPTNLIIQIIMIPVFLWAFAGTIVPFQISALVETVLVFIIIPFALAIISNRIVMRTKGAEWKEKRMAQVPMIIQTVTLSIVVFFMFAGQTETIINNAGPLAIVLVPVIIFFVLSYVIIQVVSRKLRLKYGECALLTCTSIARNSPIALAIAFGLFPNEPLIQVAIIIGVLIELPVLVYVVRRLNHGRLEYCKMVGEQADHSRKMF